MKILFLFGAGASNGGGQFYRNGRPEKPSLGKDLFDTLRRNFSSSWGNVKLDRNQFCPDFEKGMKIIWDNTPNDTFQLMKDMAIYFASFASGMGINYYNETVQLLISLGLLESTCFSSLNYECLLEYSLSVANLKIDYFSDNANVLKPHGSCNFLPDTTVLSIQNHPGLSIGNLAQLNPPLICKHPNEVINYCSPTNKLYPAMSLYLPTKATQIGHDKIMELREKWAIVANVSEAIIVIGVNPNAEDDHIWGVLEKTVAKILFVGDRTKFENWSRNRRPKKVNRILCGTFKEAIENKYLQKVLQGLA